MLINYKLINEYLNIISYLNDPYKNQYLYFFPFLMHCFYYCVKTEK